VERAHVEMIEMGVRHEHDIDLGEIAWNVLEVTG
jgi:hypothetical protein